jgi:hypothetical protein
MCDKNMEGLTLISEYCGYRSDDDRSMINTYYESTKKLFEFDHSSAEYSEALIEKTKIMFDQVKLSLEKAKTKFISGSTIGLSDFCVASFYFVVMEKEPTLIPVFLDEFEMLKEYFKKLEEVFEL